MVTYANYAYTLHVPTEPNKNTLFIAFDVTAKYNRSQFAQQWKISKTFACLKKRRSPFQAWLSVTLQTFKSSERGCNKTSENFQR